ncbi:unnamed protein product [Gadus morhua 'NCC']
MGGGAYEYCQLAGRQHHVPISVEDDARRELIKEGPRAGGRPPITNTLRGPRPSRGGCRRGVSGTGQDGTGRGGLRRPPCPQLGQAESLAWAETRRADRSLLRFTTWDSFINTIPQEEKGWTLACGLTPLNAPAECFCSHRFTFTPTQRSHSPIGSRNSSALNVPGAGPPGGPQITRWAVFCYG